MKIFASVFFFLSLTLSPLSLPTIINAICTSTHLPKTVLVVKSFDISIFFAILLDGGRRSHRKNSKDVQIDRG